MQALIWPEHHERRRRLRLAARALRQTPVRLVQGDALEMLPDAACIVRRDAAVCIFHTHVANQMSDAQQKRLLKIVDTIGAERDVCHLYNRIKPGLHLTAWINRRRVERPLAKAEGHGRWVRWEHKQ